MPIDLLTLVGAGIGKIFRFSSGFGRFAASVSDETYECEAETFELYFDKLSEVKEVNKLTLFFSGGGTPDVRVLVGTRKHRFQAVTWSTAKLLADSVPGETAFFFRNDGAGSLIRFKIQVNNTSTNFVSELTHLSFDHLENEPDDPE